MRHGPGILVLSAAVAAMAVPYVAAAQSSPLVLEVRGGASTALGRFRSGTGIGEGAGAGPSLEVAFILSGQGRRSTYLGFSQDRFTCTRAGCPVGHPFIATGVEGGFRFSLCSRCSVAPWVRIGALTTRVESAGVPGSPAGVSRLAFGGDAGFGVYLGAWRSLAFDPGVRLAAVNTRLPGGPLLRMRYAVFDLGMVLAF